MLAYIYPVNGGQVDNELPGGPPGHVGGGPIHRPPIVGGGPIIPPPLPGVWPPPGHITHPIVLPPMGEISQPIVIPGGPEHPIAVPPGIWPPLPPGTVWPGAEKLAILIWVVGVGWRWLVIEPEDDTAQPK
jgi:hypothetical protein